MLISENQPRNELIEIESNASELAGCYLGYVALFSFLSPIISYSYTGRFKALCFFTVAILAGFVGLPRISPDLDVSSKRLQMTLGVGIAVIATIDNSQAVLRARRRSLTSSNPNNLKHTAPTYIDAK